MTSLRSALALVPLVLALGGCPSDDGQSETETSTETTASEETTAGECTPAGTYADCGPDPSDTSVCMAGDGPTTCVVDSQSMPTVAVCGRPCTSDCECWAQPADGDAPSSCVSLAPGDDGTCILDCSGGASCPTGMACLSIGEAELCVYNQ